MPHLSPMKWLNIFIFMMIWMFMFIIKLNFLYSTYPSKKNYSFKMNQLTWNLT